MKESTAGVLALTGAGLGAYVYSDTVRSAINYVSNTVDSVIGTVGKTLSAASPVLLPLGLAAGTGYLGKKLVGDKVKKGEVDHYGNTAAIGAGAWGLGTFGNALLTPAVGTPLAGLGATLFAGTALHKKYGFYGAALAGVTAATIATGLPQLMLGYLGIYGLDKIGLGDCLRNKFNGVKR